MPRKTQLGSPRAKLTADLLAAIQQDFALYGKGAIERLRAEKPDKYAELAAKFVLAESDPPNPNSLRDAQSMHDIGERLLRSIGVSEPTAKQVTEAIAANDVFVATLEKIRDNTTDLN